MGAEERYTHDDKRGQEGSAARLPPDRRREEWGEIRNFVCHQQSIQRLVGNSSLQGDLEMVNSQFLS